MILAGCWIHETTAHVILFTYVRTHLHNPWSRVFLEKLTGSAASQEIPRILWNPKAHHRTHNCPPPVPILSQILPVPITSSQFLKIHLNIILPPLSGSPQWSVSLKFPTKNLCTPLPSPIRTTCHPISCSSILPPAQYSVRSTDH